MGILFLALPFAVGCAGNERCPVVIFLDGAGWYSGGGGVERGLREAGYIGEFRTHGWHSLLGPAHDHFVVAPSKGVAKGLTDRIARIRKKDPTGTINIMGLSAASSVILSALEQLPKDVMVDNVVLLSPTASAEHNLRPVMEHVRRNLYATCSPHDALAASLVANADGRRGAAAGQRGFRLAKGAGPRTREAYERVINVPWRPAYVGYDWNGSHTGVVSHKFIAGVIAPRLLSNDPYPLDRPLANHFARTEEASRP